jgi:hypothetical protein
MAFLIILGTLNQITLKNVHPYLPFLTNKFLPIRGQPCDVRKRSFRQTQFFKPCEGEKNLKV